MRKKSFLILFINILILCLFSLIAAACIGEPGVKGDKGDKGDRGQNGTGIYKILKTYTKDEVDTYTIIFDDATTTTFTVTNGVNGVSVKNAEINALGELVFVLSDESTLNVGKIVQETIDTTANKCISNMQFQDNKTVLITFTNGQQSEIQVPVCEHLYNDWNIELPSSCITMGVKTASCIYCNNLKYEFLACSEHTWCNDYSIKTCSVCGEMQGLEYIIENPNGFNSIENREYQFVEKDKSIYTIRDDVKEINVVLESKQEEILPQRITVLGENILNLAGKSFLQGSYKYNQTYNPEICKYIVKNYDSAWMNRVGNFNSLDVKEYNQSATGYSFIVSNSYIPHFKVVVKENVSYTVDCIVNESAAISVAYFNENGEYLNDTYASIKEDGKATFIPISGTRYAFVGITPVTISEDVPFIVEQPQIYITDESESVEYQPYSDTLAYMPFSLNAGEKFDFEAGILRTKNGIKTYPGQKISSGKYIYLESISKKTFCYNNKIDLENLQNFVRVDKISLVESDGEIIDVTNSFTYEQFDAGNDRALPFMQLTSTEIEDGSILIVEYVVEDVVTEFLLEYDLESVITQNLRVSVGELGDFQTLNEALEFLSMFYPSYKSKGISIEASIMDGTIIDEQIFVEQMDLSYISILSENSENIVEVKTTGWSGITHDTRGNVPFFSAENGASLPTIKCLFRCITENNNAVGYYCNRGSKGVVAGGYINVNGQQVRANIGFEGFHDNIIANNNSEIVLREAIARNAIRYGVLSRHISRVSARSADMTGCGEIAAYADRASMMDVRFADLSNSNMAISALHASTITANETIAKNIQGDYVCESANGSMVNATSITIDNVNHVFKVYSGGVIVATSAKMENLLGNPYNIEINQTTSNGIIYA